MGHVVITPSRQWHILEDLEQTLPLCQIIVINISRPIANGLLVFTWLISPNRCINMNCSDSIWHLLIIPWCRMCPINLFQGRRPGSFIGMWLRFKFQLLTILFSVVIMSQGYVQFHHYKPGNCRESINCLKLTVDNNDRPAFQQNASPAIILDSYRWIFFSTSSTWP